MHSTLDIGSGLVASLTVTAFCQRYGVSKSHVYRELDAGRLRGKKTGQRLLITNADEWFRNLPDAGLAKGAASDAA